jgi:predicted lactoylglutathione lyase
MEPRVSLITLGVDDLARSRAFYEALGLRVSPARECCEIGEL